MLNLSVPGRLYRFVGVVFMLCSMNLTFAQGNFTLTLLHNNDAESQLISTSGQPTIGGAARFKATVDAARTAGMTSGAVVTVTSGDNYIPSKEFEASINRDPSLPFYDAELIAAVDYDALCLGNHDFDFGPQILADLINDVNGINPTPFLSANLDFSPEPALASLATVGDIAPATVVTKDGRQIGIIGATTPNLNFISSPGQTIVLQDVATLVQAQVDALTSQGVDIIIVISHLQGLTADRELAAQLSNVDIIVAGGGDEILANPGDALAPGDTIQGPYPTFVSDATGKSIPTVTTGGELTYLGRLEVIFDAAGNIVTVDSTSGPILVEDPADAAIQSSIVDSVAAFVAELENIIVATTEVDLDGVRTSVRGKETNEGNLIADALLARGKVLAPNFSAKAPTVAIANGGGIRNNNIIPATSTLSAGTTFDILPFGNLLAIVEDVTPAQFKLVLENAYARFDDLSQDGTGRFAQVSGFTVVVDSTQQEAVITNDGTVINAGNRIITVTLTDGTKIVENGAVVGTAPNVNIAIPDFLARGGDQYPFAGNNIVLLGETGQQSLATFLTEDLGGVVTAAEYPAGGEGRVTVTTAMPLFTLKLLHNNDAESQLISASGQPTIGGAARFKATVDAARATGSLSGGVVTVTSGDNYIPSKEFEASVNRDPSLPFYDAELIAAVDYDALCLGNHDFDFGPQILADLINDVNVINPTPFLSANLDFSPEPALAPLATAGEIAPATIVTKNGRQIGIIGATTPNLNFISTPGQTIVLQDVATLVQAQVDALTSQGVDIIIVISHLQGLTADRELAAELSNVDIIVAGGGDEILANPGDALAPGDTIQGPYPTFVTDATGKSIPTVTTGGELKYLGCLSATFDAMGNLVTVDPTSGPILVEDPADAAIQSSIVDSVAAFVAELENIFVAETEVDLDGVRSSVRGKETNEGNLIADALLARGKVLAPSFGANIPTVALANGGGIRNNNVIPAGDTLSAGTTFDILPFGNLLAIVEEVTPAQFKLVLENAYARFDDLSQDGTGRFAQVAGFTVVVDSTRQEAVIKEDGTVIDAGSRIIMVTLNDGTKIVENGNVVTGAPNVNIAIPDFLARGGDQYPFGGNSIVLLGESGQQSLATFLAENLSGVVTAAQYPVGGEGRITVEEFCNIDAGTIDPINKAAARHYFTSSTDVFTLKAATNGDVVVPNGYDVKYVVAQGRSNPVIRAFNEEAVFSDAKRQSAIYTIHTLVYDANPSSGDFLDLSQFELGTASVADIEAVISRGICADITPREDAARFILKPCRLRAGTLTADASSVTMINGMAKISATPDGNRNVSSGFSFIYVLTSGSGLVIEQVSASPEFTVTQPGDYTIHTLVYSAEPTDEDFLDLSIVVFGTTTGVDVLGIINDLELCADLDVAGAPITVLPGTINRLAAEDIFTVAPIPASVKVAVRAKEAMNVTYELTDLNGRSIYQGTWNFSSGQSHSLNLENLIEGIYQLSMVNPTTGEVFVEKVIKQ